ncbi:hypothetical protein [Pseudochelatococcus sp. G4_1912]|uniref:hypothetical protein n=1 Tax=Pseudochelatococcus sp. G4_1912 TaxID=3114288 RepID=UPI0039C5A9E0
MMKSIIKLPGNSPSNGFENSYSEISHNKSIHTIKKEFGVNAWSKICKASPSPFFATVNITLRPYFVSAGKNLDNVRNLDKTHSLPGRIWNGTQFAVKAIGALIVSPLGAALSLAVGILGAPIAVIHALSSSAFNKYPSNFPKTERLEKLDRFYTDLITNRESAHQPLTPKGQDLLYRLNQAIAGSNHNEEIKILFVIENTALSDLVAEGYESINTLDNMRRHEASQTPDADKEYARFLVKKYREMGPSEREKIHDDDDMVIITTQLDKIDQLNKKYNLAYSENTGTKNQKSSKKLTLSEGIETIIIQKEDVSIDVTTKITEKLKDNSH